MVEISTRDDVELDSPTLVEGLPGVGLVGKIAADHILDELGLVEYGAIDIDSNPPVAVFEEGDREVKSPMRLFASPEDDLLVLQSAVPIEAVSAEEFFETFTEWVADADVTPIYLAGIAEERDPGETPGLYGISTGTGSDLLSEAAVEPPTDTGLIQGPGGALLREAKARGVEALGLLVEADPRFPDPAGAQQLIEQGIEPIADVEIDIQRLSDEAEEIVAKREQMIRQMEQAEEQGGQVSTRGMFQ